MFSIKVRYPADLDYQFFIQNGKVKKFATIGEAENWGKANLNGIFKFGGFDFKLRWYVYLPFK